MVNVTVKTLDSQNHVFDVEDITVKQFKETISPTIGIPADQQRLIFRGRVLQDDKQLSEYNVANNVVHVVQRPTNQNSNANDEPPPRPSNQAGGRMGDGGLFFGPDDVGGGGGRNAIFMGAIGLPTIEIDGGLGDDGSNPRRTGAHVRLMVGNHMLNRASTMLQRLEDDDFAAAASASAATSSSSAPTAQRGGDFVADEGMIDGEEIEAEMEIDDPGSLERLISQVVNAASASTLVGSVRPNQADSGAAAASQPTDANASSVPASGVTGSGTTNSQTSNSNSNGVSGGSNQARRPQQQQRPEQPRLRELATALQDLLALQDRLNPFLRFVQVSLRENQLYSQPGETQSTQYVYDTISNVLHLLSHSLHAFSDIMCDFSIAPEERRLNAPSSVLVEQSTVLRASIPLPAMLAAGGVPAPPASNNNNSSGGTAPVGSQPQQPGPGMNANPLAGLNFTLPMGQMSGSGVPRFSSGGIPISIPMMIPGMPPGVFPAQQWRNPNLQNNTSNNSTGGNASGAANSTGGSGAQNPDQGNATGPSPTQAGGNNPQMQLPPGLQSLGALLGMAGVGSTVNVNVFAGAGGGPTPAGGGFLPPNAVNLGNFRMGGVGNASNNNNSAGSATATPSPATGGGQRQQNPTIATNNSTASTNGSNPNANGGQGSLQNFLRNELSRPQFDNLLPCHTYHTSSRFSRTNQARPAEFRQYVNMEGPQTGGQPEGESLEILMDLVRNSRIIEWLQPVFKDVVTNYLMRGRDPNNDAHVKTCAKALAKKLLPFFERFSNKVEGKSEAVDIPATYVNILTDFITSLMKISLGNGQFKVDVIKELVELQKKLILGFKICYPDSTNVGLLFINFVVEQWLGGTSLLFKNQARLKLIEHLRQVESTAGSGSDSFIVRKQQPSGASAASSSVDKGSTSTSQSPVKKETSAPVPPAKTTPISAGSAGSAASDDVDIDEVLQLPPSMVQQSSGSSAQRRSGTGATSQGLPNQTDSVSSHLRNLPSDWESTLLQDISRQREMPAQPSFSPGYNTLFPRKH